MTSNKGRIYWLVTFAILAVFLIAACSSGGDAADSDGDMEMDEHSDEDMDEHSDMDMEEMEHNVPEEAASVVNPIEATDESIAAGADVFATNCATCHGDNGEGDGPAGVALDPPPANLHQVHVQENSDGALFHIISNGVEGTGMPAWEDALSEDDRWNVINFIRTLE